MQYIGLFSSGHRVCRILAMLVLLVVASATFAAESYPQALLTVHDPERGLRLDPIGHINPVEGTAEFWFMVDFDPGTTRDHQSLFEVRYGSDNSMVLYYNALEKALIFYIRDKDNPRDDYHSPEYPAFMVGKVDWARGQRHHVAVTWSPAVSRIYLNGEIFRKSYFRGGLIVDPQKEEKRELLVGPGRFKLQAARFWSGPRAPRQMNRRPRLKETDELRFPATLPQWPAQARNLQEGRLIVALNEEQTPIALAVDGQANNWMWQPARIETDSRIKTSWLARLENDALVLSVDMHNPTSQAITTDLTGVFPILQSDMMVFYPAGGCPFPLREGRMGYSRSRKASSKDAKLPLATLYQPGTKRGLTITPGDRVYEDVTFDAAMEGSSTDLRITHAKVKVEAGQTRTISWYLAAHDDDWRPGLGTYARLFPDILRPPQGPIATGPQSMIIGGPSDPEFLVMLNKHHIGWREVTLNLGEGAGFGNYIPDDLGPYMKSLEGYRIANHAMNEKGIHPMMYIQARECKDVERAVREFSESVVRLNNGDPLVDQYGPFGASMNCEPGSAWFNHLVDQAHRIMDKFPESKGFFFDNAWETRYGDITKAVAEIAHARGKSIATNGANSVSIGWSDSVMAESHTEAVDSIRFLGLVKPVTYVPIYSTGVLVHKEREHAAPGLKHNLFRDIRYSLVNGVFYSFNYRAVRYWPKESLDLFERYKPLQAELVGRKWLLHAHALKVPANLAGNLFEQPAGSWLITLSENYSAKNVDTSVRPDGLIVVKLIPGKTRIKSAMLSDLSGKPVRSINFEIHGEEAHVDAGVFHGLATIKLVFEAE